MPTGDRLERPNPVRMVVVGGGIVAFDVPMNCAAAVMTSVMHRVDVQMHERL
jgi:hypothetical protein